MKLETFRKSVELIIEQLGESSTITLGHLGLFVLISRIMSECIKFDELMALSGLSRNTLRAYIQDLEEISIINKQSNKNGIIFQCNELHDVSVLSLPNSALPTVSSTLTINNISSKSQEEEKLKEIIDDLNSVSGSRFTLNATDTKKKINWLLKQGYTLDDFKKVHRAKKDWLTSPKMAIYYRPKTLYAQENFESYLNERKVVDSSKATTSKWEAPAVKAKVKEHMDKLAKRWGEVDQ